MCTCVQHSFFIHDNVFLIMYRYAFFIISNTEDCSLVAGLSDTLTFLVTVILFFLVALLVAMLVYLHGRKREKAPPGSVTLDDKPFPGDTEEETTNVS